MPFLHLDNPYFLWLKLHSSHHTKLYSFYLHCYFSSVLCFICLSPQILTTWPPSVPQCLTCTVLGHRWVVPCCHNVWTFHSNGCFFSQLNTRFGSSRIFGHLHPGALRQAERLMLIRVSPDPAWCLRWTSMVLPIHLVVAIFLSKWTTTHEWVWSPTSKQWALARTPLAFIFLKITHKTVGLFYLA